MEREGMGMETGKMWECRGFGAASGVLGFPRRVPELSMGFWGSPGGSWSCFGESWSCPGASQEILGIPRSVLKLSRGLRLPRWILELPQGGFWAAQEGPGAFQRTEIPQKDPGAVLRNPRTFWGFPGGCWGFSGVSWSFSED